ncbi:MAG: hypothetical protein DBX55_03600 [Verrucomicrobia bacterium]|nr:MAG: hypothetical protein DBX55_03600 [Verrucomicrobiota bacterium]
MKAFFPAFAAVLIFAFSGACRADGVAKDFLSHARAIAAAEKKTVLAVFSGYDWSPACQRFENDILKNSAFKNYAKRNLVVVKIDVKKDGARSVSVDGREAFAPEFDANLSEAAERGLAAALKVDSIPFAALLDSNGKPIFEMRGCPRNCDAKGFVKRLRAALRKSKK